MTEQTTENTLKSVAKDNTLRSQRIFKKLLILEAHLLGNSATGPKPLETDSLHMNVRETNLILGSVEVVLGRIIDLCGYDVSSGPGSPVAHEVDIDITDVFQHLSNCIHAQEGPRKPCPQPHKVSREVPHTPRAKRPSEIKAAAERKAAKKAAQRK